MSAVPLRQVLHSALAGENACVACGSAVPVSSRAVAQIEALHRAGSLESLEPEGVRMLLLLGSLEAGCGVAAGADGRMRASCPWCVSPDERALAAQMTAAAPAGTAGARRKRVALRRRPLAAFDAGW
jgi:hypothetical protein